MAAFKTLDDFDLTGKRVLVRADLNVPVADGEVTDATRIERLVPTIREIIKVDGKAIILSHFGRPTGKVVDLGEDEFRRSIYVQVQRSKPLGLLETFDAPAMSPNCEQRASSTNAPQSLMLMNNSFVLQQADAMAERIELEVGEDLSAQFQRAWEIAYCRSPSASQLQAGVVFLGEQAAIIAASPPADPHAESSTSERVALSNLCQALVMSNGFLYVE